MSITIKDVAKESNLSIATISRYISGGHVKESNKWKIESAIKKLHYIPNTSARMLRSTRSYRIGVLFGTAISPHKAILLSEMERILTKAGYALLYSGMGENTDRINKTEEYFLDQEIDGVLAWPLKVQPDYLKKLSDSNVPVVILEENWQGCSFDCVQDDCSYGIYQATTELIKNGHVRIAIITGNTMDFSANERLNGYLRAMEDYCMPIQRELIVGNSFSFQEGYDSLRRLWKLPREKKPTAIIPTNYDLAQGMIAAIAEIGINILDELSVILFDDFRLSEMFRPTLSAVRQPLIQMADSACNLLLDRIQYGIPKRRTIVRIKPQLIKRDSVANILDNEI
jgi:LacI family transcriptional regulator